MGKKNLSIEAKRLLKLIQRERDDVRFWVQVFAIGLSCFKIQAFLI
jgi:uncharacterized membrane protein YjjP (DUF1212 family)